MASRHFLASLASTSCTLDQHPVAPPCRPDTISTEPDLRGWIYLDVDEILVHEFGNPLVLERFMGENMTPVTSGITDRKKDGLVFLLGSCNSLRVPFLPLEDVSSVL